MNKKVFRTMIIISFSLVVICFILRRFFIFDMFDITKDNATLDKICIYLQDHKVVMDIVLFPFYLAFNGLYLLSVYKVKWFDNKALVLNSVVLTLFYIINCFIPRLTVIIYAIQFIILPIITKPCVRTLIDTLIGFVVLCYFVLGLSYIKGIVIWANIDLYKLFMFSIDIFIIEIIFYLYRANYSLIPIQLRSDKQ